MCWLSAAIPALAASVTFGTLLGCMGVLTIQRMDFNGATPREAAERLFQFLKEFADENGLDFQYHAGGTAAVQRTCAVHVSSVAGASLYVEMSIEGDSLLAVLPRLLFRPRYGYGRMIGTETAALLVLRRDDEGIYRWHRLPAMASRNGRSLVRHRHAPWFPLLSDHIIPELLGACEAGLQNV